MGGAAFAGFCGRRDRPARSPPCPVTTPARPALQRLRIHRAGRALPVSVMKKQSLLITKMQQYPQLLRRPLPPKHPKLPLYAKKTHTAKTGEIETLSGKFTQDETTPVPKKPALLDVSSEEQAQGPINIQADSLDQNVTEAVTAISTSTKSRNVRSMFIPSYALVSTQFFKKNIRKMKRSSEKSTTKLPKVENIITDKKLEDILVVSSKFPQSDGSLLVNKRKRDSSKSAVLPSRLVSASHKVVTISGSKYKKTESDYVLHGDGFKTIETTHSETIIAMANLAVVTCQVHGRNALNLKGFFLLYCPDFSPLASQLIYLNLSFNDFREFPVEILCLKNLQILKMRNNPIKEIPSEIQYLKFLRIFSIAFNYIHVLPYGLFSLAHLEELDISYNEITSIPNDIQKLRSLDKLIIDGNYLFFLPPGILKLNLTKIQLENTFTHRSLWVENCFNSPQQLTHMCALFIVKNDLLGSYDKIPLKVQKLLMCTSRCEWCLGPKFGEGFRIIQSYNIFGATELPVMFHVCSLSCYRKIKESGFACEGSDRSVFSDEFSV
ncbi:leucine-rich repeat-containing protein 63-like [Callospermophilus lateralis]|uniref:leucine-rich repeat-containing protein 63-like n=1 Tax=Callospermophilus lateralis TaxID=76772 RepID=UPI0040385DA3